MRRIAGLIALVACALLTACENARPGTQSILELANPQLAPGELAAMALDPYDANRRYLGTIGLAAEPFAREPIYLRLFTDNAKDEDPLVRQAAMRGLSLHGQPEHVPILVAGLSDDHVEVRLEAARGLQRIHDPSAVPALLSAMREPDVNRQRAIVRAAARTAAPGAKAEAKPAATGDAKSEIKSNGEGSKPDQKAENKPDARAATISEEDPRVRAEAAHALGQYAEPRVLQALIAGLDDVDLSVNRSSQSALRTLTGQDFGLDRGEWLAWVHGQDAAKIDPFRGRSAYLYPVFNREKRIYEYIPFIPPPPNEVPSTPAGMPRS
jgi:hypothetical protein